MANWKLGKIQYSFLETATSNGTLTLVKGSGEYQMLTGTLDHSVKLPDATTIGVGTGVKFTISNQSTGTITVKYNDTTTLATLTTGLSGEFILTDGSSTNGVWRKIISGSASAGGSGGGVNFVGMDTSFQPTNTNDNNFESSVGNWATYADAAGVAPVDMTGGSATQLTFSRTTTSGEALNGAGSGKIVKAAANAQGQGVSVLCNVPAGYRGQTCSITMPFKVISGALVSGDLKVFIYDVTNSVVIAPFNNDVITSGNFGIAALFSVPTTCTQLRVGFHFASTSGTAVTFSYDDVYVGPQQEALGFAGSDWVRDDTMIVPSASFGTVTNKQVFWKREGDSVRIRMSFAAGTTTAAVASLTTKAGFALDSAKLSTLTNQCALGYAYRFSNTGRNTGSDNYDTLFYDGSDTANIYISTLFSSDSTFTKENANASFSSGRVFSGELTYPVAGWAANVTVAQNSTFNISSYLANGTRVTSTPANIGEYRTYQKSIASIAGTDNAPSTAPSATDGMLIYGAVYGSAGTSGQPNRWEVYVGKNKSVFPKFYASAARAGDIDVKYDTANGLLVVNGLNYAYDPITGVMVIDAMNQASTTSTRTVGSVIPTAGGAVTNPTSCYFDVTVSENALAVGMQFPRSELRLDLANGYGSTNTMFRRFTTISINTGGAFTYADSATLGMSVTINEEGLYGITYSDSFSSAANMGLSLNSSQGTVSISSGSLTASTRLAAATTTSAGASNTVTAMRRFVAGDVIRAHTQGISDAGNGWNIFSIVKLSN